MNKIIPISEKYRNEISDFIKKNWGSTIIVTKGNIHLVDKLQGYVVIVNEKV